MTSMWAALGTEAAVLFAIAGTATAVLRNRIRKSVSTTTAAE